jgi:hypothetical protein
MYPMPKPIFPHFVKTVSLVFTLFYMVTVVCAQPNTTIELTKPKPYAQRTLPAEKTGNKKFTLPRRFFTNMITRYNYYFNANKRLNDIIDRAKTQNKDEYGKLLPFYDYSLDVTAKDEIDTVIYKCNAGILLHDLRSDWVDNLYILMGRAYLLRKDFDSASAVFQYINYVYAPKDEGYDIPLGSNASNTGGVFTVATNEQRPFLKKLTTTLPSRNEALVWQVRTYLEQQKTGDAAGLLEILRHDPNFPSRLQPALHELSAYLYYKQSVYDSAAHELTKALPNAGSRQSMARWEYLAGQMYQLAQKEKEATAAFENAIRHTVDPVMEVYTRLNMATLASGKKDNALEDNLNELLKMAHRDKYADYRDIIYYTAARLELRRRHDSVAQRLLLSSIKHNTDNAVQKQQSFLLLGDLNYDRKFYAAAYRFYDSVETSLVSETDQKKIANRKPALQLIAENEVVVQHQDSLQHLAMLPANERLAAAKKMIRQMRKEKGLKDIETETNTGTSADKAVNIDLFNNNAPSFYFLNTSLKTRGANEFRTRWGNRPNIDNWRRQAAVDRSFSTNAQTTVNTQKTQADNSQATKEKELTLEALLAQVPLTEAQLSASNTLVSQSMLANAFAFQHQLQDYPSAIATYEAFLKRFPESAAAEQVLFNLSFCCQQTNAITRADSVRNALNSAYPNGRYAGLLRKVQTTGQPDSAALQYEFIYRLFIEGRFNEARQTKLKADQQFGSSYWTPQLLFIESVSYIRERQDSIAINRLEQITRLFNQSPMAAKAATMIDVLKRRNEIEYYLTNLNTEKREDAVIRRVDLNAPTAALTADTRKDSVKLRQAPIAMVAKALPQENKPLVISNEVYHFIPADSQYVVVTMNKVDPVFVSEGRNAFNIFNRERYASFKIGSSNLKLTPDINLLLLGPFANAATAVAYLEAVRPLSKTSIVPWLPADKYNFTIISPANLALLLNNKDIAGYKAFMQKLLPE